MSGYTLLLAAHGAGDDSPSNAHVRQLAAALSGEMGAVEIRCAFRKGAPSFDSVLAEVRTERVVVVPLMTSAGYFSTKILPESLRASPFWSVLDISISPPLGMHPRMIDIAEERIAHAAAAHALNPTESAAIVVGHGTRRHARSRSRTVDVAAALAERNPDWHITSAFIDDAPSLPDVVGTIDRRHLIAVPFLFGGGHHALVDIPRHLGVCPESRLVGPPHTCRDNGYMRICTESVGADPRVPSLVRDLARSMLDTSIQGAA